MTHLARPPPAPAPALLLCSCAVVPASAVAPVALVLCLSLFVLSRCPALHHYKKIQTHRGKSGSACRLLGSACRLLGSVSRLLGSVSKSLGSVSKSLTVDCSGRFQKKRTVGVNLVGSKKSKMAVFNIQKMEKLISLKRDIRMT